MVALYVLVLLVQGIVGLSLLYYYLLLIAGRPASHEKRASEAASPFRFAVAIPAHNEESVIGATVDRLRQMVYPEALYDVHIVADHCSDATAHVARASGAIVHERVKGPRGRKGYALAWLLKRLMADRRHYDAIVVFDADSRVKPDFLEHVAASLATGAQVVQGRHVIANPESSTFAALADADMRLNNLIRNQAKENLGLSARLMGDGMCFGREALAKHPFDMSSLTEDREYGIYLVAQGMRVRYEPQAISVGQATARWTDATGQRQRWYGGAFELQKRYMGKLLRAAWRQHSLDALDSALELALPPFSVLCVLSSGLVVVQGILLLAQVDTPLFASIALTALVLMYPMLGLRIDRAPISSFRTLLLGPLYALWRVWVGLTVRLRRGRVPWVRTRREEERVAQ